MVARDKLNIRNYQPDDLQAVVDIYHAADIAVGDDQFLSADMLQTFIESPEIDSSRDVFIVEHDGRVIGYADTELSAETGRGWADGVVHPDYWRQGIGTQLVRVTEARILEAAAEKLPPGHRVVVQRHAAEINPGEVRLIESAGYQYIRTFYQMRIELDQPVEAQAMPYGLALRPFVREQHAHAVYEAHQEAFSDHWGFERNGYEEWTHFALDWAGVDFSMWLIAFDEETDEVAGICLNRAYGKGDPQMAWVGTLAVRRRWRKRGLGLALLKNSFARFQQRGFIRAGLGVDASSLTNAVALYERAGMHVHKRSFAYEKVLRGEA